MLCLSLRSSPDADRHFRLRYDHHSIGLLNFDELLKKVLEYYRKGQRYEDKRHPGKEGPRYQIHIPFAKNTEIIVIVEETPGCLLPITIWPQSF